MAQTRRTLPAGRPAAAAMTPDLRSGYEDATSGKTDLMPQTTKIADRATSTQWFGDVCAPCMAWPHSLALVHPCQLDKPDAKIVNLIRLPGRVQTIRRDAPEHASPSNHDNGNRRESTRRRNDDSGTRWQPMNHQASQSRLTTPAKQITSHRR
jgi:hypothetical protein